MAWIFFRELVESELHSNPGCEQSPIASATDTHKAYYCLECDRAILIKPRSGTMSQHSDPICCPESTSYSAAFLARTSVSQNKIEQAWMESEAVFSSRSSDLPESANLDLFSSKTSLPSEPLEGKEWSKNWPRSGMTVDGRLYRPPQLEPHTKETGGSYWRTPNANDAARGPMSLETALNGGHQLALVTQVRHPELWPTPAARDWRGSNGYETTKNKIEQGKRAQMGQLPNAVMMASAEKPTGQLSPMWVEWLMGYQIGHTELDALVIQWFRSKSGKRSRSSRGSNNG